MRFAGAFIALVALTCCGNANGPRVHQADRAHANAVDASVMVGDASVDAGPDKMEMLVAHHDRVAPGMREITRREVDLAANKDSTLALDAFTADTCLRALFDADAPTEITLNGSNAMTLATADAAQGAIGAAGPVCFRKGDVATFRFNGQSRLRIVVWVSP